VTPLEVTERDAAGDRNWFAEHEDRRFRVRAEGSRLVIIRRRGIGDYRVLLRTSTAARPTAFTDKELAVSWYAAAYPSWSRDRAKRWARKALRRGEL
jgi:hypothetical protein